MIDGMTLKLPLKNEDKLCEFRKESTLFYNNYNS